MELGIKIQIHSTWASYSKLKPITFQKWTWGTTRSKAQKLDGFTSDHSGPREVGEVY